MCVLIWRTIKKMSHPSGGWFYLQLMALIVHLLICKYMMWKIVCVKWNAAVLVRIIYTLLVLQKLLLWNCSGCNTYSKFVISYWYNFLSSGQCCCPWPWSLALACPRGQILSPWLPWGSSPWPWPWPWKSRPWPWPWAKVLGLYQPGPWP